MFAGRFTVTMRVRIVSMEVLIMFKYGTYWSISGSLQLTGGEQCLVTNFAARRRNQ